jgi:hypothetical protein
MVKTIMRVPLLFRRENSEEAHLARREAVEKAVADGLRRLAALLRRAAETIEARRLVNGGYRRPHTFLERAAPRKPRS